MKKAIWLLFVITLANTSYSQIEFENGYFIDNNGVRTECEIKNIDWKNNPSKFSYRLLDNQEVKSASINEVKEFGVGLSLKYIRFNTKIDLSKSNFRDLSRNRNPEYLEKTVFLKVILEGKISLLSYEEPNIKQFYLYENSSLPIPLVYKQYLKQDNTVAENGMFRQQLLNTFKCADIEATAIESTSYIDSSILSIIKKYHECENASYFEYKRLSGKTPYHISLRPGFSINSLSTENNIERYYDVSYERRVSGRLGIESELILPYNKNKWSITFEAAYQAYKTEKRVTTYLGQYVANINYRYIEIPIGIRHSVFLKNSSRVYLSVLLIKDFDLNSTIKYDWGYSRNELKIGSRTNLGLTFGYQKKNISAEYRIHTNRNVLGDNSNWSTQYRSMSFIVGYTVF